MKKIFFIFLCFLFSENYKVNAQKSSTKYSEDYYKATEWRNIGPFRGGRSAAVTGVAGKANLFYFGSTGGGVWRTTDAGNTFENISDGFFGGSVGSVAVSEWDNNVIYVGNGEKTVRGNVSSGDGIWKSVNAGKTWEPMGLKNARHIPRVRIHPKNPDIVFAGVLGDLYKSTEERGVYKSVDGGKTWNKKLFANKDAGVVDLIIDPNNSRVLYATTWNIRRTPYSLSSGGDGSALWKSTDEGETWTNISTNKGLPGGIWGISGVTVSPVNSDIVWALIENEKGGVYKSTDAGKTWKLINNERKLRQRAWYYTRLYADTQDEDILYVLNVRYHKSTDGGKTYKTFNAPHGDHHDLWIAPEDNQRMIIGDDGGAQVSFDAGINWSTYKNQPTSQFYRVTTDNHFPYRIYGAQQDNSTVRIAHRTQGRFIGESDWESTAGGESAHLAIDPTNNDIVYGGSYGGLLTRQNHTTGETRAINVWPDDPMGHGAEDFKYRFQWNFPIMFSPNHKNKLYAASNHLHMTTNEGQSWKIISPDLTRNDPSTLKSSGGPITKDNTGVEYYATIFAVNESRQEDGLIWTGSDDGLVHVTKDGGKNWTNVTPKKMPEWMMVNCIEIDPFTKGGAYIVGTKYKSGDYLPYVYKTENYGKSWKLITNGIGPEDFTRALRADPKRKGLLYAGTERGMYISFDDGNNWKKFQLNLPTTGETRAINVWPDDPMGHGAEDFKYRFQWNFPIMFSPNHKNKLYAASNHLHMTTNEGQSWKIISPDLTRNDPSTLKSSGGPITKDNTGVEYYATIFAVNESKQEDGLIWTGSDDGLVHVTRDGGKNWTNVTPKKMPEWMMINCIEIDPFTKGGAYIVGTKYKSGDYLPYVYKTENYGKSWKLITNGIGAEDFTRALRADPKRKGLLYAGTERGMYISFDDGNNWKKFQLNCIHSNF